MANIHQSKEVYKKYRNIHGDAVVVPVTGVYVTGIYRPPYYVNHGLTISSLTTQKATVVDFTEDDATVNTDNGLYLLDFTMDVYNPDITIYTTSETNVYNDNGLYLLDFTMDVANPDITYYSSDSVSTTDDVGLYLLDFTMDTVSPTIIDNPTIQKSMAPESMLLITGISTSQAVIS